jgi:hypothetical protein
MATGGVNPLPLVISDHGLRMEVSVEVITLDPLSLGFPDVADPVASKKHPVAGHKVSARE